MTNDLIRSLSDSAALVQTGDVLGLGGMTLYRRPVAFVVELLRQRARNLSDLTILTFAGGYETDLLIGAGMVRRVRSCYVGLEAFGFAPMFTQARGLEVVPETEASIAFGLRAAMAGVGFMPARGWLGTDMPRLRPDLKTVNDPYSGEELIAFPALTCDVAVIHALAADPQGNARLGQHLAVDQELALVARTLIITAEEIVGELPRDVDMVGAVVSAVVHTPRGAWPTSCHPLYPLGGNEILRYIDACNAGHFEQYVAGLTG